MIRIVTSTIALLAVAALGYGIAIHPVGPVADQPNRAVYLKQLENDDKVPRQIQADYALRNRKVASEVWMSLGGGTLLGLLYGFLNPTCRAKIWGTGPTSLGSEGNTAKPAAHHEL